MFHIYKGTCVSYLCAFLVISAMKYQVCGRRKKKGVSRSETNLRRFWKRPQIGGWWDGKILSFPAFNTPAINVANVPITKGLLFAEDWCSVYLFWHFIVFQVSTVTIKQFLLKLSNKFKSLLCWWKMASDTAARVVAMFRENHVWKHWSKHFHWSEHFYQWFYYLPFCLLYKHFMMNEFGNFAICCHNIALCVLSDWSLHYPV